MGTSANNYLSMVDAVADLKERGYVADFKIISCTGEEDNAEDGCRLKTFNEDKMYDSDDLVIREHYRFEGPSNPDDMSVVYAIEANDGVKGTVIDAFGTYSSAQLSEFFRNIRIETDSSQTV